MHEITPSSPDESLLRAKLTGSLALEDVSTYVPALMAAPSGLLGYLYSALSAAIPLGLWLIE